MSDPTVLLRLAGTGPADRLHAWVEALGRTTVASRILDLTVSEPDVELRRWCDETGVEVGDPRTKADVVVLASAGDLPTPGALHRLVAAVVESGEPHQTRVLPWGATADGPDAPPTPAPVVCVAFPAGADQGTDDVRRLASAAVLTDRRAGGATAPAVRGGDPPPYGHPAAMPATALHLLLRQTGLPTPELPVELEERPFLTVLARTQGTRLLLLEETMTCLAGQSSRDFEVVLACHRVGTDALAAVHDVVAAAPAWLRERVRVLEVERQGRSAPLNDALDAARGRYAVMLDDDDAVAPDWVAAFAALEATAPGTVLRSVALAQDVRPVPVPGLGAAAVEAGPAHPVWPEEFNLTDHLWDNASPPMTFAVPRGVFADLGHRFDETLDTTEDWDFLLRAAILTGVTSTPTVTAAYRVWTEDEGSRHLYDESHWARGREALLRAIDEQVALLPPKTMQGIRDLQRALLDERAEKFRFAGLNERAAADLVTVNEAVVALRQRISLLEERLARRRRRPQPD